MHSLAATACASPRLGPSSCTASGPWRIKSFRDCRVELPVRKSFVRRRQPGLGSGAQDVRTPGKRAQGKRDSKENLPVAMVHFFNVLLSVGVLICICTDPSAQHRSQRANSLT
jgi:hypothetical protein